MAKKKLPSIYQKYTILIIGVLVLFIISFLIYTFVSDINENKANSSYLVKHKLVTKSYNITEDLSELKNNKGTYFVYLSYTGSKEIYSLEKDLKSLIKQYKLKDKFYYVNLDSLKDNANKITAVNELLGLTYVQVTKVPTIIYVTNGEIKKGNIITRLDDNLFEKGDFQQLLDINEL